MQLREKDLSVSELIYLAYGMKGLTVKYDAKLFVNDRLDIAMSVDADGIHLGQSSMPVHAARRVVGDKMLIGVSTHNLDEARTAQEEGADFITFGPIYPTPSKMKFGEPVGLEALRKVRSKILIPILGIGGIRRDNIVKVLDSGADGIALISGILGAKDVRRAAEEYVEMLPG